MIQYGEVFPEVRQRVAAFRYWQEYMNDRLFFVGKSSYGVFPENEYLDSAYRFLYTSASKEFMEFCAKKEEMSLDKYLEVLDVCMEDLIYEGELK